ncbi:ATP-dependent DNA helicase RecG [Candidatus Nomurabacteria bacterium]|nr:ATP-dependent DNA helicase RecG [Candidatus Nomurabacteria bacterium]
MNPEDSILKHFTRLQLGQTRALEKLELESIQDLLFYFPTRYGKVLPEKKIDELVVGDDVTIYGQVVAAKIGKAWKKKISLGEVTLEDQTGRIKAIWFHQPYLAKKVSPGNFARLQGKVSKRKDEVYLANPEIEATSSLGTSETLFADESEAGENYLLPIYPETRGLSSLWIHHAVKKILKNKVQNTIADPLPEELLKKYHLPKLATALVWIHSPRNEADSLSARKRFAFEEIFFIQLERLQSKLAYHGQKTFTFTPDEKIVNDFVSRFPFPLTNAQNKAIKQILKDFSQSEPMTRLLEGDVGSGKTAVAVSTALAIANAGGEVAYMAPTEILARQHFDSFISYFKHLPRVQIGLITGAGCYKFPSKINPGGHTSISRPQLLKWVANGEIPILVGTHALIQKAVKFKNLAYAIIDEQHRFGVMQRAKLTKKDENRAPHLLSMTATPIPRTLALTIYGDLDLTLLDELPLGRKPIKTETVSEEKRHRAYSHIKQELQAGRQVFVICPRIDEPDPTKALALQTKSAKAEAKRLQEKIFPNYLVGLVHGKLKPADKEEIMADFVEGKINILVATSVVEVGVNVPNATIIVIEGAERFGLAQLHQLRGRVLRSSHQAHCYLFTSRESNQENARLKSLEKARNGFELAELDLKLRGAGSLSGVKQWGLSDLGMEAIKNIRMVEAARLEAQNLLKTDSDLKNHPLIKQKLIEKKSEIHFE